LLDGGHFLLESRLSEVVGLVRPFLERHLLWADSPLLASV
jgi:surfactin synthase thioesterase subunit